MRTFEATVSMAWGDGEKTLDRLNVWLPKEFIGRVYSPSVSAFGAVVCVPATGRSMATTRVHKSSVRGALFIAKRFIKAFDDFIPFRMKVKVTEEDDGRLVFSVGAWKRKGAQAILSPVKDVGDSFTVYVSPYARAKGSYDGYLRISLPPEFSGRFFKLDIAKSGSVALTPYAHRGRHMCKALPQGSGCKHYAVLVFSKKHWHTVMQKARPCRIKTTGKQDAHGVVRFSVKEWLKETSTDPVGAALARVGDILGAMQARGAAHA